MRRLIALLVLAIAVAAGATAAVAQTKVQLAVGGQSALYYLPLTVTDRLGFFKDEGLDVEISDLSGGARALQALMGGSADVVTGSSRCIFGPFFPTSRTYACSVFVSRRTTSLNRSANRFCSITISAASSASGESAFAEIVKRAESSQSGPPDIWLGPT